MSADSRLCWMTSSVLQNSGAGNGLIQLQGVDGHPHRRMGMADQLAESVIPAFTPVVCSLVVGHSRRVHVPPFRWKCRWQSTHARETSRLVLVTAPLQLYSTRWQHSQRMRLTFAAFFVYIYPFRASFRQPLLLLKNSIVDGRLCGAVLRASDTVRTPPRPRLVLPSIGGGVGRRGEVLTSICGGVGLRGRQTAPGKQPLYSCSALVDRICSYRLDQSAHWFSGFT
jgi:hypothetical protein